MKKAIKKPFILTMLALSLAGSAAAQPSITFERELGEPLLEGVIAERTSDEDTPVPQAPPYSSSSTKRHLGKKMSEIVKIQYHHKSGSGIYEKQTRKVQKHTLLDISYYTKDAEGQKLSFVSLASYIIGAKNMSEGYCLISPMNITEFMTDPLVQSIQALPETSAYLSDKIVNPHPHLLSLRFYEQEHPDFIERYGILSYLNKEHNTWEHFLLLDAYYPKNLESALEQDTLQAINTFVHKYATLADAIEKYYGG